MTKLFKTFFFFWGGGIIFLILLLFMKIKVHAMFELGTCGLVDRSYARCATEI